MLKNLYDEKEAESSIRIIVEKVRVEGNGVILLTGPSSCGKGEIAKALCKFLSIPKDRHLSMGEILRSTIAMAKEDIEFRDKLSKEYNISDKKCIFNVNENKIEVAQKAESYKGELCSYFNKDYEEVSQLDWLEFCVLKGLLIPDEWTVGIIDASLESSCELHKGIFILDGYPRTVTAAQNLLKTLNKLHIPIIKVLNLSITKHEMKKRALSRKRNDDTEESLERRYQFYIDKVQPSIDYFKEQLGANQVVLVDAHQPVFNEDKILDVEASINNVVSSVMQSLGLPNYLLDLK